ncbi:MAG: hypothetical protein IJQ99_10235 [Synergistaceae bacterium]|nr:hypothetical protein [Synergistaceae bacterium]
MKKLLLLLFLCAQPSSALTKYFYSTKIQEFCIQVDRAYAEEGHTADETQETEELTDKGQQLDLLSSDIIELTPLVEFEIPFEIPDGLEEDLASLDQAEPLFIVTASGDNSDNSDLSSLLFSDEPFIIVKQINTIVEIMMRGFSFTPTAGIEQFFSLQWDKITGILDIKIIEDEAPVLEENEIKIGNIRIKIKIK